MNLLGLVLGFGSGIAQGNSEEIGEGGLGFQRGPMQRLVGLDDPEPG